MKTKQDQSVVNVRLNPNDQVLEVDRKKDSQTSLATFACHFIEKPLFTENSIRHFHSAGVIFCLFLW